ncbi:MAG TPA: GntR family transcriptional regulator [Marmoricola sp.]|nr:GntR family transcriptional regulator [Marmoricola sp.]
MVQASDSTRRPRYVELAARLREEITTGEYADTGRLPSEDSLAQQHGVSRGTVRQALSVLRTNGLITSRRGTPRVILGTARTPTFYELMSFTQWARAMGEVPGARTIEVNHRPAEPVEAEQLQLEPGAMIYQTLRVRTMSRRPVIVERMSYPEAVGELIANLRVDAPSHADPLVDAGLIVADLEHSIDVVTADATDASLLGIDEGDPLMRERRRATDPAGVPLHWAEDRIIPGTFVFTVHNSAATTAMSRRRG